MAFDVITPVKFANGEVSLGITTFYTVPEHSRAILKSIDISNINITRNKITVYLVPDGDSAGSDNILIPNVTVQPNSIFQWGGTQVLNEGDTIQAIANLSGLSITISGATAV